MRHSAVFGLLVATMLFTGCGKQVDPAVSSDSTQALLAPPSRNADINAWRSFLSTVVLSQTHDETVRPYSFVVPAGHGRDAEESRAAMVDAIRGLLTNTALPHHMIVLTGPDSTEVTDVIVEAFRDLPEKSGAGLTVVYVGVAGASARAREAAVANGAQFRLTAIREPA
ncbi:hypothetical protein FHW69_000824 [Luteibacter sp. Sphag1AF]|uniref:hypothetical protein n=1 Tax=Luteibacter sp. Sphag1AF TaxID=2587031 RepID=UPI0016141AEC|nr:hypothetical protein [Luteibacter sp. Sphag1AF]MBB3226234.1 hypothetical protein [Luteibacter sp. Sphag1AF]